MDLIISEVRGSNSGGSCRLSTVRVGQKGKGNRLVLVSHNGGDERWIHDYCKVHKGKD